MSMSFRRIVAALSLTLLTGVGLVYAQTSKSATSQSTDAAIEQLRKDARADKADIIASAMGFTATEAAGLWPLYKSYETAQKGVGDEKVALIKDYAANYYSMTDVKAGDLVGRLQALENETVATKQQFVKSLQGVLPATKLARYYQLEDRIQMLVDLNLASEIPLVK